MIYGKTDKQRLAIKKEKESDGKNWFAWHPVQLENGQFLFWERVWREFYASYVCSGYTYYLNKADVREEE